MSKKTNVKSFGIERKHVEEQLQGTEQWHADRNGRFTGSKTSDLMGTGRSTSKMEWDRPEKICDFSDKSIK